MSAVSEIILRRWSALIRDADRDAYVDYVARTGLRSYSETPGNLGYQLLTRDVGDGTVEVTTLSWWSSFEDIESFSGTPIDKARYYPDDDAWLVCKPDTVEHHIVVEGTLGR